MRKGSAKIDRKHGLRMPRGDHYKHILLQGQNKRDRLIMILPNISGGH